MTRRIVITGGPGAGKSTLLAVLAARGYRCVDENARAVIRQRKAVGLAPRPAPLAFAQQILRLDVAAYEHAGTADGPVFFDRSALDALGMLDELGALTPSALHDALRTYRYTSPVLLLPPWREIYRTDTERDQSFEDSVRVHDALARWYVRCGYALVTVPPAPVDERCAFVLGTLDIG